jgi:hypothetical protein
VNIYAKVIYLHREGLTIRKIAEVLGDDLVKSDLPYKWTKTPLIAVKKIIGNEMAEIHKQREFTKFVAVKKKFNRFNNQKIGEASIKI